MRGPTPRAQPSLAGNWLLVGQALAFRAFDHDRRPRAVVNLPQFIAEGKLVAVTIQMSTADMVIDTVDSAL